MYKLEHYEGGRNVIARQMEIDSNIVGVVGQQLNKDINSTLVEIEVGRLLNDPRVTDQYFIDRLSENLEEANCPEQIIDNVVKIVEWKLLLKSETI